MQIYYLHIKEEEFYKSKEKIKLQVEELIQKYNGEIIYTSLIRPIIFINFPDNKEKQQIIKDLEDKLSFIESIEEPGKDPTII